jgi:hypothetical protein
MGSKDTIERDLSLEIMYRIDESKDEGRSRMQLIDDLQSSDKEIVAMLFKLRQKKYIFINEFKNPPVYLLTRAGKEALPPKYVKDPALHQPERGVKHVIGIGGKVDLSKPLKGPKLAIYKALERPLTSFQIFKATNLNQEHGYAFLQEMEKMGIIDKRKIPNPSGGKDINEYFRAMEMKTEKDLKEPPAPKLIAALPGDPILEAIADGAEPIAPVISNFSKLNPSVDEAIDELAQHHSMMDIIMSCLARLDSQLINLNAFKESVTRQLGDMGK